MLRGFLDETIERCAQVAEKEGNLWSNDTKAVSEIAAAIRKLKDEPAAIAQHAFDAAHRLARNKTTKSDPNIIYPGKDPDFVFPEE